LGAGFFDRRPALPSTAIDSPSLFGLYIAMAYESLRYVDVVECYMLSVWEMLIFVVVQWSIWCLVFYRRSMRSFALYIMFYILMMGVAVMVEDRFNQLILWLGLIGFIYYYVLEIRKEKQRRSQI